MARQGKQGTAQDPTFTGRKRGTKEILLRVGVYLLPYKMLASATIICAILALGFSFVFPRMTPYVIDDIILQNDVEKLAPAMMLIIGAFFLSELFNSLRIRVNNHLEQNVILDMRRQVYSKLQRLPASYFDQRASGDLMTRVIEDVNNVERVLIDGTEQGTVAILSVLGVAAFLISMNPSLALIAFIPIPLLLAGALCYTLTAHGRYRDQRRAASGMNALLMDNLQGIREIKSYGREPHEDSRFQERANDLRSTTLRVMRAWATYSPSMEFCMALGVALVLWFGGRQVLAGAMQIGELAGFLFFLNLFYEPIRRLHQLNQLLQAARAAGERVFDILDTRIERDDGKTRSGLSDGLKGDVVFENVHFNYDLDAPVLKNISLQARPGDMVALVGPTGAGKSTIVNLLPAFYEVTSGRILIDGQDIAEKSLGSVRDKIAIVNQEPFLFNGTVRENILYGNLEADEPHMIAAAHAANCHEFISRLPETYDTHVGERGVKLSVGEKQRISIARALLKDSPILILDEATASVDTATERLIQEALERLMAGRTSFVIAHRLSTVKNADQILVLRHGEIIERGSHEELVELNGLYAKLARIQNTTFIEESFEKLEA